MATRVYHNIPAAGDGLPGVNYDETAYGYDLMGRQNRTRSPGGTITRTVFDARGRAVKTYVGTNDGGATDDDPTGALADPENNMVLVAEQQYDGGAAGGDGNLTRRIEHVDRSSANSRTTRFAYDCRNRLVTTDGELDYFAKNTYDNLDRVVRSEQYDTTEAGALLARRDTRFDERGRVYQTVTYAVNADTGDVVGQITSNTWYDASGRVIKEMPGGSARFTKTRYEGLGRPVKIFTGYDAEESSYADAANTAGDTIFEQSETEYDPAGNVVQTTSRQRFHDAVGTGELADPVTEPRARVTYSAAWYDAAGRKVATADYGTNGGEPFARPDAVPERSDTCLVTSTRYNLRGEASCTNDPMGREDRVAFDDAGRTIETIENYQASPLAPAGEGPGVRADANKTTRMTYTPDGQLATLTALNPTTGDQTTRYVYGSTLVESFVARSDLLRAEIYPDSDDSRYDDGDDAVYDRIEYSYNAQGQRKSLTDQNGTVRGFLYDKLGRLVHDYAECLGEGVDGRVRRISRTYGVAGLSQHPRRGRRPARRQLRRDGLPRASAWPHWAPRSSKRSALRRTGPVRRGSAARATAPARCSPRRSDNSQVARRREAASRMVRPWAAAGFFVALGLARRFCLNLPVRRIGRRLGDLRRTGGRLAGAGGRRSTLQGRAPEPAVRAVRAWASCRSGPTPCPSFCIHPCLSPLPRA